MATGDQYELDIASVQSLVKSWQAGTEQMTQAAKQLAAMNSQLESAIPSSLIQGLLGVVDLAACFAAVDAAASQASALATGLGQDEATLEKNLSAYLAAEAQATAKLKAAAKPVGTPSGPHGGATTTAGAGGSRPTTGHSGGGGGGGASGGGGGGGGSQPIQPPGPDTYANQSQVEAWINQAFQVLEADGVPASELNEAGVLLIIEHESSGNPNAINNWDSNAKAGDPSRGLMQVIGTTFDEYSLPGHNSDIYDPVSNIIAGVRYALSRYGSIQSVPGVKSVDSGGSYVGY